MASILKHKATPVRAANLAKIHYSTRWANFDEISVLSLWRRYGVDILEQILFILNV